MAVNHGTLVIADTYTWTGKPLSEIGGMVGIGKPQLPDHDDSLDAWHHRCKADVLITRQAVTELLDFVRGEHLGNWQPSGAGMGYTSWRHRFLQHKVLVHDDAPALAAERRAMHAGRAEAWWHGQAPNGQFTEWDMHMSYCRIAAECDVPVKLFAVDVKPSARVHSWAKERWTLLCDVEVTTDVPCVPVRHDGRTLWPVGTFTTTLWQPELDMLVREGGNYRVLTQWRYNMAPALREWAQWSMSMCAAHDTRATPLQKAFVKHQSRAVIGRLGLKNASWQEFGANPYDWCGITDYVDGDTGETSRMMHVGDKTFLEAGERESRNSLPQMTGYIMSVARVRLWDACRAAGLAHVVHVDTDSLICDRYGSRALRAAIEAGLPGGWRAKDKWHKIDVTGPRHYRASGRRVVPGVPRNAAETAPGVFTGQSWESLATALADGRPGAVRITTKVYQPTLFDGRRPWTSEGPALPIRLPAETDERNTPDAADDSTRADDRSGRRDSTRPDAAPADESAGGQAVRDRPDARPAARAIPGDRPGRSSGLAVRVRRPPAAVGSSPVTAAPGSAGRGASRHHREEHAR